MIKPLCIFSLIVLGGFSISTSFAEENHIPTWIKDAAGFWSEDKISDQDFLQSLQYLIDNDFLLLTYEKSNVSDPEFDLILNVHTNKQEYRAGDDIVIFGTINKLIGDQKISIVVSSIKGNFISIVKIVPNVDGSYAFVAKDSAFKEHGQYIVNVYYAGQVHKQISYTFTPAN